ncbi:MAG: GspH/FimT family pseudopilin [Holophagales bacterium]|nr:MAG: GspH/FimT family pseudopilin [Holophagales bacterium]
MTKNGRRARSAGFSLIEAMVVIALIGILATLGLPAFLGMINRSQLLGTTRELAALMRSARIEAVRRGVPTVVIRTADGFTAFVNDARDGQGRFSNLTFDPPTEREIGRLSLPRRVHVAAPALDSTVNTFSGTAPTPPFAPNLPIVGAVFMPDGSALAEGAFRVADGTERNFFEIRLAPRFTGHVVVRKFDSTPPSATATIYWYEAGFSSGAATGSGPNTWEWD